MTSMRQWLRTSRFILFILLGMSLFWESCGNSKKKLSTINPAVDTLPNILTRPAADGFFKNFRNQKGNVDRDFLFNGDTSLNNKVCSFRLNNVQAKDFFKELASLKESGKYDSIRIRVRMAFRGKEGTKLTGKSNFFPVLELIVDTVGTGVFYPLRSNPRLPISMMIKINPKEADTLIKNWKNLPIKDITKQLFLDEQPETPENRIQYFTFGTADTEDIYKHQKMLAEKKKPCLFFIHLGQLEALGDVGLRTIIHLTSSQNMSKGSASQDEGDEDFEFSAPCPHHCQ